MHIAGKMFLTKYGGIVKMVMNQVAIKKWLRKCTCNSEKDTVICTGIA